jgi:hypothetical protein
MPHIALHPKECSVVYGFYSWVSIKIGRASSGHLLAPSERSIQKFRSAIILGGLGGK